MGQYLDNGLLPLYDTYSSINSSILKISSFAGSIMLEISSSDTDYTQL